jgi:BMFP domain-containing protein YqiC
MKNKEETLKDIQEINAVARNWWRWFWGTIFVLLFFYIALVFLGNYTPQKNYDLNTTQGRQNYKQEMIDLLGKVAPKYQKYMVNLSQSSKENIKQKIKQEVAAAFEPVYLGGIKNFSQFHYSIKGEYLELYYSANDNTRDILNMEQKDNLNKKIYELLFGSVAFDTKIKEAYNNINLFALNEITKNINTLHTKIENDFNITQTQADFLVKEMLDISIDDMKMRFNGEVSEGFRVAGVGAGSAVGFAVSKQILKVFSKKLATKLAIKGGTKLAGAEVGAATGVGVGLVCGPAAVVCSSVGGLIGGAIGWFATDAIVISIDEYYNAEEFEQDLKRFLQAQQREMENKLIFLYEGSLNNLDRVNKEKFEKLKHTTNKDLLLDSDK